MFAALLIACTGTPDEAPSALAGCERVETRRAVWDPEPWWVVTERWDARGRRTYFERILGPEGDTPRYDVHTWTFDGPNLIEESIVGWDAPNGPLPALVSTHAYDDAGHRSHTDQWYEDGRFVGTWTWAWDDADRPAGGTFDSDDDGEPDGERVETWTKEPYGWRVDIEEDVDGQNTLREVRELDEAERELWRSEDWGTDGVTEVIEAHTYDDDGRLVQWELSGAAVIYEGCTYSWSGDSRIAAECSDGLHDGTFSWDWIHHGGRERIATVTHHDGGTSEPWENVEYTWTCGK